MPFELANVISKLEVLSIAGLCSQFSLSHMEFKVIHSSRTVIHDILPCTCASMAPPTLTGIRCLPYLATCMDRS